VQPDVAIVWNGMADIRMVAKDILLRQDIPFFYAEKGLLPHSWYIDENGINATSSLNQLCFKEDMNLEEKNRTEKYIADIIMRGVSAWGQPARLGDGNRIRDQLGVGRHANLVFFPGQVDQDVNIAEFSPFRNVVEAVELALESIPDEAHLIVKPHPKSDPVNTEELFELRKKYSNLIIIEDVNIWDVIESSDLVISINSTVAFESLLRKKKVILLGDGVLSNVGLVDKTSASDLASETLRCLNAPADELVDFSRLLAFLSFLLEEYYIFRNMPFPLSVFERLQSKCQAESRKLFSREELWTILYKRKEAGISHVYGRKKMLKDVLESLVKGNG
jgi:capsule polysaccharide modification protein KpsS